MSFSQKISINCIYLYAFLAALTSSLPSHALKIPICVQYLAGNTTCNTLLENILSDHRDFNETSAFFVLYFGLGILPLASSLIDEQVQIGRWGKKYRWAIKIKDLLDASSNKNTSSTFISFYAKLSGDYQQYSTCDIPSEEAIKSLIINANQTGVLCEYNLMEKIIAEKSLFPLRWVILSGQLEHKVDKLEKILGDFRNKELCLQREIKSANSELYEVIEMGNDPLRVDSALKAAHVSLFDQLNKIFNTKIIKIENFIFKY